jgi:prolyl oligopeptidase
LSIAASVGRLCGVTDPYLWLEELDSDAAREWVLTRNRESTAELSGDRFTDLVARSREVLDSVDRIPYTRWRGEHLYNFWQDENHPRGLWRRTTLDEYRKPRPEWLTLLDVDALAAAEGENWVWQGSDELRPENERFLISLSRGGADAAVVREFDVTTREFVADGFTLPEAKSSVAWIDRDRVYVGTDFGPGSLTSSGYPRIVKQWRRGTPLAQATTVFEGEDDDVSVTGVFDQTPGFPRHLIFRSYSFFSYEVWIRRDDGALIKVDVPGDAIVDTHREWLLVRLRSDWEVEGKTYPAGALLAADLEAFLAGGRDLTTLFEPDPHTALDSWHWTRHHLVLALLRDVQSRLELCTPANGWARTTLAGVTEFSHTSVADTNPDLSDEIMLRSTGFLEPPTLRYGTAGAELEVLKREPEFFDASGMTVRQFFATSDDGTQVPYFVVGRPEEGPGPTLMSGYGGFDVSRTPGYSGTVGRSWLERGGTYVVANIRGGGEYGPHWHYAALRENRPRAYEDFAAVARDLVDRGITTAPQLGIEGGSNGGLLTSVMLTRYPRLFGAIVVFVPLADMRRYHKLLAGASWIAEYGDPDVPEDWEFIRAYSPYHNIHSGVGYPPALFITSTRDDRVHPAHARKMVARLREYGHDVRYYENIEGGHGAAADNAQRAFRDALLYEFLWQRLP